jgi:hypothetical protein
MMGDATMEAGARMKEALNALLDGLTKPQREQACLPFDDHTQRASWAYFPRAEKGLSLAEMNHRQIKLFHRLLRTGLSWPAYVQANSIMAMENVLDILEAGRTVVVRDQALYYVSIFLDTSDAFARPRGWRIQGHHVSIHYTFSRDGLASWTPLFLGSNPARVQHDGYDLIRPLGETEDRARELLASLSAAQKSKAVICESVPPDVVLGILPQVYTPFTGDGVPGLPALAEQFGGKDALAVLRFDAKKPLGIAATDLTGGQRELLAALLGVYAGRFPEGLTWLAATNADDLHFAWAGTETVGKPHYYRLQGPEIVVEYDNIQNDANHVHTVTRSARNDFGADALALHHLWDHA